MDTIELGGSWEFIDMPLSPCGYDEECPSDSDWGGALDARVPGEVHLDLLRHGRIPEPLFDRNAVGCAWIEERAWWFRRRFSFSGEPPPRAELVFEGIDLNAVIRLNGKEVGRSGNALIPHSFDVTGALRNGENELIVRLDAGVAGAKQKPLAKYGNGTSESIWLRKAAFTFGWDWAPRLVNCGIWRPVCLNIPDALVLRNVWIRTRLDGAGQARVAVLAEIENLSGQPCDGEIMFCIGGVGDRKTSFEGLAPGRKSVEAVFDVPNPCLWWPRPLGEAHLYNLDVRLHCRGMLCGSRTLRFGIREITLLQEPLDGAPGGTTFNFLVNGEKCFINGANWAPSDCILARITPERRRRLLSLVLDANLNMLRVWGGGIYEEEDFYDFCDANGILVWQDFMMACFVYPGDDPGFRRQMAEEIAAVVPRLRNHPSLALWCGSNESDWAFDNNWYPGCEANTSFSIEHEMIPDMLRSLDPDRPYRPTSPWGGADVNGEDAGDQHWWAISIATGGNDPLDYRNYRRMHCTFNSEYGYFGMPSVESIREYLPEDQMDVASDGFRFHVNRHGFMEKGQAGRLKSMEAIDLLYGGSASMPLDKLVDVSQLLQAEAIKAATEQARRRKYSSGGSMFWMFADAWGEVGWSVVDHYMRKKAAYEYVRRACAPVLVSVKEEECGLSTWIVNDTLRPLSGTLELKLMSFDGSVRSAKLCKVHVRPNCSTCCFMERMSLMRSGEFYLAMFRWDDGSRTAGNIFFFMNFRSLKMPKAVLAVSVVERMEERALLRLATDNFAHFVRIDTPPGLEPEDSCFDMLPGSSRDVELRGDTSQLGRVSVRCLNQ